MRNIINFGNAHRKKEVQNYPVIPWTEDSPKIIQGILMLPAYEPDLRGIEIIRRASCRFCGQQVELSSLQIRDAAKAEESATLSCNCPEAKQYQERLRAERDARIKREEKMALAAERIEDLFGEGAPAFGNSQMPQEVLKHLLTEAEIVLDLIADSVSIEFRHGGSFKIAMNAKGNMTVERGMKRKIKQEV